MGVVKRMKYSRNGREKRIRGEACSPLDYYIIGHTGLAKWGRLAFRALAYTSSVGRFCYCVVIKVFSLFRPSGEFPNIKRNPAASSTYHSFIPDIRHAWWEIVSIVVRSTLGQSR